MTITISEFLRIKRETRSCSSCQEGNLIHKVVAVSSKVDKSAEELLLENQEDVRKTIEKIKAGDERTIRDIYGDKPNESKKVGY
jgi:hypothetical protein